MDAQFYSLVHGALNSTRRVFHDFPRGNSMFRGPCIEHESVLIHRVLPEDWESYFDSESCWLKCPSYLDL